MFLPRTSALLQIVVVVIPRILAATDLLLATSPDSTSQKPLQRFKMPGYSAKQFQEEYELNVDPEFEWNGSVAEWASGQSGPRFWGDEDELVRPGDNNDGEEGPEANCATAITRDGRFLAVSTNLVIEIYDTVSLALCSKLVGHDGNIQHMIFVDSSTSTEEDRSYVLFSQDHDFRRADYKIHTWHIDANGALRSDLRELPIPVELMSDTAVDTIRRQLEDDHALSPKEFGLIRDGFTKTLKAADARNRIKRLPTQIGNFPSFNSQPISHNRTKAMHVEHGETTQHGMRSAEDLPQIVITNIATGEESCRLKGHQDAIMWAGWSPDDKFIATASWDETYRIWNADTGECQHVIGKTGGQNWAGAFLPDGKHVILSGGQPVEVAVYNIKTAQKVTTLSPPDSNKLDHWMRYFVVHPSENLVILQNEQSLLSWKPDLSGTPRSEPAVEKIFALAPGSEPMRRIFNTLQTLKWADHGRKLLVQGYEGTTYVWDKEKRFKWRFQKPKDWKLKLYETDVHFIQREGGEWVASQDKDGKVRFWKL